jgi:hypothetical protein
MPVTFSIIDGSDVASPPFFSAVIQTAYDEQKNNSLA